MVRQRDQGAGFAQGHSRGGGDGGDGSAGGGSGRGRGGRPANATRTVFQPTVRAPPLGVHGRVRDGAGRSHAELKAGRSGLALVNKRSTAAATAGGSPGNGLTAYEAGAEQQSYSTHESSGDAAVGPANPWLRHAQSPPPPPAPAPPQPRSAQQKPPHDKDSSSARTRARQVAESAIQRAPSMRWDEMVDSGTDHIDSLDDYDDVFASDGSRTRAAQPLLETSQPDARAEEPTSRPATQSSGTDCPPDEPPAAAVTAVPEPAPGPTLEPAASVVAEPQQDAPDAERRSAAASRAETWGIRAKAANGSPAPEAEQPVARWSKASLASGSRLAQMPGAPTGRKPATGRGPPRPAEAAAPGDSNSRAQGRTPRGSSSRQQPAHVPTVTPPVVLARASARSVERRPPANASGRARNPATQPPDAPTTADEPPTTPAQEATPEVAGDLALPTPAAPVAAPAAGTTQPTGVEPNAKRGARAQVLPGGDSEPKATQPPGTVSPANAQASTGGDRAQRAESWRSAAVAAPVEPSKAPGANRGGSAARSAQRPPQPPQQPPPQPQSQPQPQPGERRERGRASTGSLAAASGNWRSAANRAEKNHAPVPGAAPVPGPAARPARAAAVQRWPDTPAELHPPTAPYVSGGVLGRAGDDRQRSHTQGAGGRPRGDIYSRASLHSLAHLSETAPASAAFGAQLPRPLACAHNSGGIHGMASTLPVSRSQGRGAASPPLLPHAMLADILGDGEPAARTTAAPKLPTPITSGAAASGDHATAGAAVAAAVAGEAHARNRRISSIVGAAPRDDMADAGRRLGYATRVRSASSLFDVAGSSGLAPQTASDAPSRDYGGDSDLFLWQQQSHKGGRSEPPRMPAQSASMPSVPKVTVDGAAAQQVPAEQPLWGYAPMHSAPAVLHPLYAQGAGGLAAGMVHGFQAFSPGAGMLWPDPGPRAPLPQRKSRPQSRDDNCSNNAGSQTSGKPPRPIGTRGSHRGRASAQNQAPAAPQYQQPVPPTAAAAARYPWQMQYAYGMPQGAVLDSSLSYFTSQAMPGPSAASQAAAPYMVPVPHMVDMGAGHQPMMLYPQVPMMEPMPAASRPDAVASGSAPSYYAAPAATVDDAAAPLPLPMYPYPPYPGPMGVPEPSQQYMPYMSPPPSHHHHHHGGVGGPHHMAMVPMYMGLVDMQSGATMAEPSAHIYSHDGYPVHGATDGWPGYPPSGATDTCPQGAPLGDRIGGIRASTASRQSSNTAADAPAHPHAQPASRPARGGRAKPPQDTPPAPAGQGPTPSNPPQQQPRRRQPKPARAPHPAPAKTTATVADQPADDSKLAPRTDRRRRPAKGDGSAADDGKQRVAHRAR
ncbi:hypothetical protein H4R19_001016, partial [Coemansia spiralis]